MKKILIIFMFLFLLTGCGNKNNELVMVTEAGFAPYEYYEDGKIVGAVTHVLVHDSTMGYGIFIEWMLQESGINYRSEEAQSDAA